MRGFFYTWNLTKTCKPSLRVDGPMLMEQQNKNYIIPSETGVKMENCKLMRRPDVEAMTGLKRSSIYAMMDRGAFPKPLKLSERSVAWVQDEVVAWVNSRIAATRSGGAK